MNNASAATRPPITDSPWYWLYLFATFALVALILMGPKFSARQAQMERNYQARQRAVQNRIGEAPSTPLSSEDNLTIKLWPLYVVMTVLLLAGWSGLWYRYYHPRVPAASSSANSATPTSDHAHTAD